LHFPNEFFYDVMTMVGENGVKKLAFAFIWNFGGATGLLHVFWSRKTQRSLRFFIIEF
jgi:hypothetical protein